jgi:hypothetical protein
MEATGCYETLANAQNGPKVSYRVSKVFTKVRLGDVCASLCITLAASLSGRQYFSLCEVPSNNWMLLHTGLPEKLFVGLFISDTIACRHCAFKFQKCAYLSRACVRVYQLQNI